MQNRHILTLEQAAEVLQFHPNTVGKLMAAGELKGTYRMLGKSYRFTLRKLLEYIERGDVEDEKMAVEAIGTEEDS